MKRLRLLLGVGLFVGLVLLGSRLAVAKPVTNQYYGSGGGGMIQGTVLGFNMYDQLEPVAWASVFANNGQRSFVAYTSAGGFYQMFVPVGIYNVTVNEPGYKTYANIVSVSDGSTSSINFILEQSHVPIPEYQPNGAVIVMVFALAAALVIRRRYAGRSA
jgi:hypothetical protein